MTHKLTLSQVTHGLAVSVHCNVSSQSPSPWQTQACWLRLPAPRLATMQRAAFWKGNLCSVPAFSPRSLPSTHNRSYAEGWGAQRAEGKRQEKIFPQLKKIMLSSRATSLKSPVTLHSAEPPAVASSGIGDFAHSRVLAAVNPFQNKVEWGRV